MQRPFCKTGGRLKCFVKLDSYISNSRLNNIFPAVVNKLPGETKVSLSAVICPFLFENPPYYKRLVHTNVPLW